MKGLGKGSIFVILFCLICFYFILNLLSNKKLFKGFEGVKIEEDFKLERNDLELFKFSNSNEITPIVLIKSVGRDDIKLFKFKNFYIYSTVLHKNAKFGFDDVFLSKEAFITKTSFNRYYNYNLQNGVLSLGIEKLGALSSIYLMNLENFEKKRINQDTYCWFGKSNNLGLKYNSKDSPLDFYFHSAHSSSLGMIVHQKSSDQVYVMFVISDSTANKNGNKNQILEILSDKIRNIP